MPIAVLTKNLAKKVQAKLNPCQNMKSSDDRSYLQVHLWRSTTRKMTYPLFLFATFYMSGAVCLGCPKKTKFTFVTQRLKSSCLYM